MGGSFGNLGWLCGPAAPCGGWYNSCSLGPYTNGCGAEVVVFVSSTNEKSIGSFVAVCTSRLPLQTKRSQRSGSSTSWSGQQPFRSSRDQKQPPGIDSKWVGGRVGGQQAALGRFWVGVFSPKPGCPVDKYVTVCSHRPLPAPVNLCQRPLVCCKCIMNCF